jgi:hypothetical protein
MIDMPKQRTADVTVTLRTRDGSPVAHQPVTIAQKSHKFLFGGNGPGAIKLANNALYDSARERAEDLNQKMLAEADEAHPRLCRRSSL